MTTGSFRHFLLIALAVPLAFSCKKSDDAPSGGSGGTTPPPPDEVTVTDVDDNTYNSVLIGGSYWMSSNLMTTHYRDGSPIPNITGGTEWVADETGAYCEYNNSPSNAAVHGRLYNWYAVNNTAGLCPLGWHVPTDLEWQAMETALGMSSSEVSTVGIRGVSEGIGGMLKSTSNWNGSNTGATNSSGFSGIASGYRSNPAGAFGNLGFYGYFYSATDYGGLAWYRSLRYNSAGIERSACYPQYGKCVRCVQD